MDLPPGGFSNGGTWYGGPFTIDAFGARRAPSPVELIEKHKSLVFAMAARNRHAVMRVPLRLLCDGSRRILGGKPRSACDPVRLATRSGERLARAGLISPGAVDQVFEVRNHPMLDVLEQPDPYGCLTKRKLIGLLVTYQDIVGHGFLVPEGNGWDYRTGSVGATAPEYLWMVFPQYCTPFFDGLSPIPAWWQYFRDRLPFQSVIWFRQSVSLKNPYGSSYSPAYAGLQYAEGEDRFMTVLDQALGFSPIPAVMLSAKDPTQPPGDSEAKRLAQDFMRRHSGAHSSSGVFVNNGAYDVNIIQRPPTDLGAKEMSEYDLYRLASVFDQPPTFYTVDTNLANLQAAREQHALDGVEPRCWSIAETLTHFVRRFDRRLFFAFDPVLAEDELKRAQIDKIYVDMGRYTVNQLNEESKYPPVPWGKEPLLNKTLLPYSLLVKQAEQAVSSQQAATENAAKQLEWEMTPEPEEDDAEAESDAVRSLAAGVLAIVGRS